MDYNLDDEFDFNRFCKRFEGFKKNRGIVSLSKVQKPRSIKQNAYIHVLFKLFAIEFGYTEYQAKTHLKRNCSFMVEDVKGEKFLKSTKSLKTDEMAKFIEWVRNYAAIENCYLPSSEEYLRNKFRIDSEIHRSKEFL